MISFAIIDWAYLLIFLVVCSALALVGWCLKIALRNEAIKRAADLAYQQALDAFRSDLKALLKKGPILKGAIQTLALKHCIDGSDVQKIVCEFYQRLINRMLSDGRVTPQKQDVFSQWQKAMGIPSAVAHEIERNLKLAMYRNAVKSIVKEGFIAQHDGQAIEQLRVDLTITAEDAKTIALEMAASRYAQILESTVSMREVTPQAQGELDNLLASLRLTTHEATSITTGYAKSLYRRCFVVLRDAKEIEHKHKFLFSWLEGKLQLDESIKAEYNSELVFLSASKSYRALLTNALQQKQLTSQTQTMIQDFHKSANLSTEHNRKLREEIANDLYRAYISSIETNDSVTPYQAEFVDWLENETFLTESQKAKYRSRYNEIKKLTEYRAGILPSIRTHRILESGELCHWESDCTHAYETKDSVRTVDGELLVTSKSIRFLSSERTFSFTPGRILHLSVESNRVFVESEQKTGTGSYKVSRPKELCAILEGLVGKAKYLTFSDAQTLTRHIPRDVRQEVYHRDGGRCVECGATEYLEFDHVIPHSKGGANSAKNIQLLCRKCNLRKSDRI